MKYLSSIANQKGILPSIPNLSGDIVLSSLKAFPSAEGYGKNTTGGRSGTIIHVTNLNPTGAGSLREAMETTGNRTIVFDVSGYIDMDVPLKIRSGFGNVTIAGQTSPDGIVIRGADMNVHEGNVIIRYLKVAPGEDAYNPGNLLPSNPDYEPADTFTVKSFSGQGGIDGVYIDHCTFIWGHDSIIDFGGGTVEGSDVVENITLSNSLLAENIDKGYGTLASGVRNLTYLRNIFYSLSDRTPAISTSDGEGVDYVNNYHYYTLRAAWYRQGNVVDFINNVWESGSLTRQYETFRMEAAYNTNIANSRFYFNGNFDNGVNADTAYNNSGTATPYVQSTPFHQNNIPLIPSAQLKNTLLNNVGSSLFYDSQDIRIMNNIKNNTGSYVTDEANVGGYPTIPTTARSSNYDSIADGIDDSFSTLHGITSSNQIITNWDFGNYTITNNAGYTAMEIYLAYLAGDFEKLLN